jgi:hypothetical protein
LSPWQELHEFLKDLTDWEQTVKIKEKKLAGGTLKNLGFFKSITVLICSLRVELLNQASFLNVSRIAIWIHCHDTVVCP